MTYLIETAKTLNLSKAANNLFISQPSLSYQIKTIEEEIGFLIFERIGKSIRLTPAGEQLIISLQRISSDLQFAIEQAQNMGKKYTNMIKIGLRNRTELHYLPDAMKLFDSTHPTIQIVPDIQKMNDLITSFLKKELDMILLPKDEADKLNNIQQHELYTSHIYLLCKHDDPLAQKEHVTISDLAYRTLLVNGGSSKTLRQVQQRVIAQVPIHHYNSPTHDFTLIQVASEKAICLSPGYLNDHSNAFAWQSFDCPEHFNMVLCTHADTTSSYIDDFIQHLKQLYAKSTLRL